MAGPRAANPAPASTSDLADRRERYVQRLHEAVRAIREKLSEDPRVIRVSLFGSFARGRADLLTDLDVLVVMESDEPMAERLRHLYERLALDVDVDVLCYTPEEFERMRETPFLRRALADEQVLHEKKPG